MHPKYLSSFVFVFHVQDQRNKKQQRTNPWIQQFDLIAFDTCNLLQGIRNQKQMLTHVM